GEMLAELGRYEEALRAEAAGAFNLRWFVTRLRRPVVAIPAALAVIALTAFAVWFAQRRADIRWAREEALPEIERMIGENDVWRNLVAPYRLAEQAEAILGDDPELADLLSQVSLGIDVVTEPPGASVYMKEYGDPDGEWSYLGVSPIEQVRMPIGFFRWKLEKEGYETVLAAASTWNTEGSESNITVIPYNLVRTLDEEGSLPPGMVRVPATQTDVGTLDDFYIGRYEVTNQEYKAFVDAGGYRNRDYWKHPFLKDGRELTWEEAISEMVDPSGQPGPSTWLAGDYPEGKGEHPVSGVSWYEAAAYSEFAGMSLPTRFHWLMAMGYFTPMIRVYQLGGDAVLAPFTNFGGSGAVPVGSLPSVTPYGAYDMGGNVREWCWNETPQGRMVRGGAWDENTYMFRRQSQAPPMDRSARNGIRLALYPHPEAITPDAFRFETLGRLEDLRARQSVPDAVFQVFREQFSYDRTELNEQVEYREESPGGWTREKIFFDAAYGGERVLAYLFLPSNTPPPYQTVVYFPGGQSARTTSSQDLESYYEFPMFLSFLVKNGRAVLYPVYKGTFERSDPALTAIYGGADSYAYTEYLVQTVKDLRRSLDYLETRPDIDSGKLAYYGMSWGGWLGSIIPAVEERFGASVLVGGGLGRPTRQEAHSINYVTRVRTPTLMLNGMYDIDVDARIRPMFDLLGTPAEDKQIILYETDHIPPRAEYIKEILAWLDKYL
ncbi:MAG: SUMF1/EgtB/PvdO family nonheme iron enzyme, partial [Longimicrobiales bacterium]|nr:SUMF1/EgtB/PvdO family nonheme iron enzyme [Longimicrobiales bacterium]